MSSGIFSGINGWNFPLANPDATTAPGVTDDVNAGYSENSHWIDVTADKAYVCVDASAGAAVWTETTSAGGASDPLVPADGTQNITGDLSVADVVATSGTPPAALLVTGAAHTGLTASAEAVSVDMAIGATVQFATGALTTQRAVVVRAPTYAFVGASTITNAATLAITAAPVEGTNATITNAYAFWVQAGAVKMAGTLTVDGKAFFANADTSSTWQFFGTATFLGNATFGANTARFNDNVSCQFGTGGTDIGSITLETAQTPNTLVLGVPTDSRHLIICEHVDINTDLAHAQQTNPTIFLQSADAATAAQSLKLWHDQTDGNVDSLTGTLNLGATGGVNLANQTLAGATGTHDDKVAIEVGGVMKNFMLCT